MMNQFALHRRWPIVISLVLLIATNIVEGAEVFRTVVRRQGDDDVHTFRIPGLATTSKGTLIAVFDIRHRSAADLPGDIDVGMLRSTDNGKSWGKLQTILDFDRDEPKAHGNGVGDPAVLVDAKTGEIFVVALWSYGNRAWHGSQPGISPDETGQLVLSRSRDDGLTWSKPTNITKSIRGRDSRWRLLFNGPGSGIQLRDGALVFAAQYRDADGAPHACFMQSRDHGESWTLSPPAISDAPPTSEAQLAQLADDSLLISMRDESRSGQRLWASFTGNDEVSRGTWSKPWRAVPDPTCMASLLAHPDGLLIYSHVNSPRERVGLAIRTSGDGGKHWNEARVLDPRPCAYSCLTRLADGSVGVLYECGEKHPYETLTFARFPLDWVAAGEE